MATIDVGDKFEGSLIKNNGNKTSGVFKLVENNDGILFFREETSGQAVHIPFQAVSEIIQGGVSGTLSDIVVENSEKLEGNSWSDTVPDVLDDNTLVEDDVLEINLGPNLNASSDGDNGVTITRNNHHGSLDGLTDDDHPQYQTEEQTEDTVANLIVGGNGIGVNYDDPNDELVIESLNSNSGSEFVKADRLAYTNHNSVLKNTIIYTRVALPDTTISEMGWLPVGSDSGDIVFGIYSNGVNNEPDSLLTTTGVNATSTTAGQPNRFTLNSSLDITDPDFYWLAMNENLGVDQVITPHPLNVDGVEFHFVRTEARTTTNGLPSIANPSVSSLQLPWIGAFE